MPRSAAASGCGRCSCSRPRNLFGVDRDCSARAATAIEAIHVYSLIHDDLPAMDDDDMRRGKPTVHKAFDEATAILAGDCLHALAFEILADPATHPDPFVRTELVIDLARASGPNGMAGGQMMDLEAEKSRFDLTTVTRLQQMKTGALISASVEAGAILGPRPAGRPDRPARLCARPRPRVPDRRRPARRRGRRGDAGKKLRKDEVAGKETFLSLLGAERAREQARMLVDQAIEHLHGYGTEADLLRDIARFVLERDR